MVDGVDIILRVNDGFDRGDIALFAAFDPNVEWNDAEHVTFGPAPRSKVPMPTTRERQRHPEPRRAGWDRRGWLYGTGVALNGSAASMVLVEAREPPMVTRVHLAGEALPVAGMVGDVFAVPGACSAGHRCRTGGRRQEHERDAHRHRSQHLLHLTALLVGSVSRP